MKIKGLIFFLLASFILSGSTAFVLVSGFDKEETIRLPDQKQVKTPATHSAGSISKGTILLLLAVGIIGVIGVSRKKKDIINPPYNNEMNRSKNPQTLNQ
jgi:hypothetical protein